MSSASSPSASVSPLVTRPPLPLTPKSPASTKPWESGGLHAPMHNSAGKRKSGSARDRLEKKLKLKKASR
jgi:hypothetical protein